ncbi:MAG: glycosyltransferase [Mollicutes bacterium]|nr:glycosyltransferase [Mollicutes bacterium]
MDKFVKKLILLFPFIDLATALITRYSDMPMSIGMIIKGIFMIILFYYVLNSSSKYKKLSLCFQLFLIIYFLLYFLVKPELLNKIYFFTEITYLFKLFYFPVTFLGLLCVYDDKIFNKDEFIKVMKYTLIIYTCLLIIPILTGTAQNTYISDLKGKIGWFYSGNEISNIMLLLIPFIYTFIDKKRTYTFVIFLPCIVAMLLIGTKVSFLSLIMITLASLIFNLIKLFLKKDNKVIYSLLIFLCIVTLSFKAPALYNYQYTLTHKVEDGVLKDIITIDEENKEEVKILLEQMKKFHSSGSTNQQLKKILKSVLSDRDIYFANTLSIYNNDLTNSNIFYGIGFSNTEQVRNTNIKKLIEMDIVDGYFHFGIFGLFIMLSPLIYASYLFIINIKNVTLNSIYIIFIVILLFIVSLFSGHVFTAPSVVIYLVIYLLFFINELGLIGRNKHLKNKISILSLHLGYGGIERAIINQANMLSEKYEVEIICLYRVVDKIPYKVNDNVKIIYLSELNPNKKEFLYYLKQKKIISVFKEGIKAIIILLKKYSLVKNYIYNSDSKVIISTRLEFTKLLNKYGNNASVKIAEEHVDHQNNHIYIKKIKKAVKNIDYLLPTSKFLTDDYKELLKNKSVKVIYIPNIVSEIPKKMNKCNNTNIISVGRLSPEKGFVDLIEIFKLVNNLNKSIKLTIVGDGIEKEKIEQKIKEHHLTRFVKLTGFLESVDLKNEYQKASLYIMTSFEESFGLVLIEAMSFGIPCIAFDSAKGAKEIINNQNGKLIKNRNKEQMAKEVLTYFKKNPDNKMMNNAKKTADKYTYDKVKLDWYNLMEEII